MPDANPFDLTGPELPPAPIRSAVFAGRYEAERVLGRGQMGEVLQVRDRRTGNRLALKRIPPELVRDASVFHGVRANFELVRALDHPHIAAARSLEDDPRTGEAFLLLDLVSGEDLAHWLIRRRAALGDPTAPLPVREVLDLAEQIAAALDYAHSRPATGRARGILHRDLKPANVMVETGREYKPGVPWVRLVDFGLAAEIQASMLSLSAHAPTNRAAGTPAYMAPEQWEGRTLTRGVDQWALAVIVYELVAGRRPFVAHDVLVMREQVLRVAPEAPPALPREAWAALRRGLSVDRRARHRSCLALVHAVAAADPATLGTIRVPEIALPEEFPDLEAERGAATPSIGPAAVIEQSPAASPPSAPPYGSRDPVPAAPDRSPVPAPSVAPSVRIEPARRIPFAAKVLPILLLVMVAGGLRFINRQVRNEPPPLEDPPIHVPGPVNDADAPLPKNEPEHAHEPGREDPADDGNGVPGEERILRAQRTTRVVEWFAEAGDLVVEGAAILRCEGFPMAADPLEAKAGLERARAAVAVRRREFERVEELARQGLATADQVQSARDALTRANREEGMAEMLLRAADHMKVEEEVMMPFNGRIVAVHVLPGEMVQINQPLATVRREDGPARRR